MTEFDRWVDTIWTPERNPVGGYGTRAIERKPFGASVATLRGVVPDLKTSKHGTIFIP